MEMDSILENRKNYQRNKMLSVIRLHENISRNDVKKITAYKFPFSYLSSVQELQLVEACSRQNMGFIAMKALSGGLIHNSASAYAFMNQPQFAHVAPIWGIQKEKELDEFLAHAACPPVLDEELKGQIQKDIQQLSGDFCRGYLRIFWQVNKF